MDGDFVVFLGDLLDDERDAGIGEIEEGGGLVRLDLLAGLRRCDVGLVLIIDAGDFDRDARDLAAEIIDSQLSGHDRAFAGIVGIGSGLVIHDDKAHDRHGDLRPRASGGSHHRDNGQGIHKDKQMWDAKDH